MKWINIEDEAPEKGRRLLYFHDMTGVGLGFYFGIDDEYCAETGHVFGGQLGFLTGDASHWCYIPDYPEGFEDIDIADAEWAGEVEKEINEMKKPIGGEMSDEDALRESTGWRTEE
jgi:hypothetical protein